MITILFLIAVSFVLIGVFSGSEMAYLSCNKLKLRHLADEGDRRAKLVMHFYRDPKRFLTNILMGTNLMHVTVTGLITYLLVNYFHVTQEWITVTLLSLLIIIFGETIPKDWFRHRADDFIYRFAPILGFLDRLFGIFSRVL